MDSFLICTIVFTVFLFILICCKVNLPTTDGYEHWKDYRHWKGMWTENKVAQLLQTLPQDEFIVLNNLMLETNYGTTQIDHIVLSTHGLYVIETKNYSGRLIGNEKSEQWEQNINGFRYKTGNALRQNRSHIAAVRYHGYIPKDIHIHNVVVFSSNTDFDISHNDGEIIYINQLIPTIMRLRSSEPIFTIEQLRIKADSLRQHNITDPELRKKHNTTVRSVINERKIKIEAGLCPNCGGKLIPREGEYSTFYGCSNYPQCDFTIKDLRTDYDDYNAARKLYRRRRYY